MMMTNERRRIGRRPFSYYMPVSDVATSRQVGVMTDISLEGFKLDSRQPIPDGQVNHFRLNLTTEIAPKASVVFTGRSKWCQPDDLYPSIYNVGFEITNISRDDKLVIQRVYENYGEQPAGGGR